MTRALEDGRTALDRRAGALVGFAFLAKELQAFLVLPAFGLVYLIAGPPKLRAADRAGRRCSASTTLVAGGWWVAIVQLWPASSRPYIGGSQNNSFWNVLFGYNGFGRLTGNETGSVGGGATRRRPASGVRPGWTRMFNAAVRRSDLVADPRRAGPARRRARLHRDARAHRSHARRARALGRLAGRHRPRVQPRPGHHPRVLHGRARARDRRARRHRRDDLLGAARQPVRRVLLRRRRRGRRALVGVRACSSAHRPGSRRCASVVLVGGLARRRRRRGRAAAARPARCRRSRSARSRSASRRRPRTRCRPSRTPHTRRHPDRRSRGRRGSAVRRWPGRRGVARSPAEARPPAVSRGASRRRHVPRRRQRSPAVGSFPGPAAAGGGGAGGGAAGSAVCSTASTAERRAHDAAASRARGYRWTAAAIGANNAAGYQLASGQAIMAIGGFNGTDPTPTLAQFEQYVRRTDRSTTSSPVVVAAARDGWSREHLERDHAVGRAELHRPDRRRHHDLRPEPLVTGARATHGTGAADPTPTPGGRNRRGDGYPAPVADQATFAEQAMPYMSALYAAALRMTRNPSDAEDLVQEPFSTRGRRDSAAFTRART